MVYFNSFLRNLKPYPLASHKIWTVDRDERDGMLKLDWNEATIPPSPKVSENIHALLEKENFYNIYPPTTNPKLLQTLAAYVGLPTENIQYCVGSDTVQEYIAKTFIAPGDPVLALGPCYDNFRLTAQANGAVVTIHEVDEEFAFDAAAFEAAIDSLNPRFIYICSPNNPTGYLHPIPYIEKLVSAYTDSMFLIDEAYWEFAGVTAKDLVLRYPNVIVSRTMSKAFAIANFRFGYMVSSAENISRMSIVRNPKNINSFTQAAVMGVLADADYMWRYVKQVNAAREVFYKALTALPRHLKPYRSEGNFILIKCCSPQFKDGLIQYLAERNIFIRGLHQSKLLESCARISIGTQPQMERVLSGIQEFIATYKA
ncbi:MAG: histidinol-phosphate aminotransferase family protein [Christensenellaceae bacterium]|jgi:histidinol-phosphate aminotransferase|nr:histidinol-phosphate aminotransferase family protein [Christensenellaceae bacterium]